jgi:hypothetical protein
MEKAKKKTSNWLKVILFVIYGGLALGFLRLILIDAFSIPRPLVSSIECLIGALIVYPLFIRGTENRWTKDKRQWDFLTWLFISVIFSILVFGITSLIF